MSRLKSVSDRSGGISRMSQTLLSLALSCKRLATWNIDFDNYKVIIWAALSPYTAEETTHTIRPRLAHHFNMRQKLSTKPNFLIKHGKYEKNNNVDIALSLKWKILVMVTEIKVNLLRSAVLIPGGQVINKTLLNILFANMFQPAKCCKSTCSNISEYKRMTFY